METECRDIALRISNDKKGGRSVQFATNIEQRFNVLCIEDYSETELTECFYTGKEWNKMKQAKKEIAYQLNAVKKTNREMISRGFDFFTETGYRTRKRNIKAVLEEQNYQMKFGRSDWDKLGRASRLTSDHCARWAMVIGEQDAKTAMEAYHSSWNKERRPSLSERVMKAIRYQ